MINDIINQPYIILPFNFIRLENGYVLLVNVVGEYIHLPPSDFKKVIDYSLKQKSDIYLNLKAKHFLTESITDPAIELLSIKYRTKKEFLSDFTSLHMFVITQRCNQKCVYCQVGSKNLESENCDMDIETAKKATDITLTSPSKNIKIEFQGGEPLLNFETVKYIIEYGTKQAFIKNKKLEFVVCTNLTMANDDMLKYLADNNVFISTSLDGPKDVHDFNRRHKDGRGTYDDVIKSLEMAKKYINQDNISALMTTTKYSLNYAYEIIEEYVNNGFNSIFLRPLNPFGYARERMDDLGYSPLAFIEFYKKVLDYIIKINQEGFFLDEAFTSVLLTRILTPFSTGFVDLQFPAGTGISGVVYGHDGNVYLSDESRMLAQMGDFTFCIGNIFKDTYKEIFYGEKIRGIISTSCAETLPSCSDCAFQMYCGIDPIRNFAIHSDIIGHSPTDDFCIIHKEIIKYLFNLILKNDENALDVFWSWLTNQRLSDISIKN